MGKEAATKHLDNVMNMMDINNDDEISYSEFILASLNREKFLTKDRLRQAFLLFDQDQNGTIDKEEILEIFINSDF